MTNFIDHTSHVSKQTFSAAVITDSKGKQVGKIIIRFTDAQIGYNHEVGVVFYPADLNFSETLKSGVNNNPDTLYHLLNNNGIKVYSRYSQLIGYKNKETNKTVRYDSLSDFSDIVRIKFNRKSYNVLWCM